ncbi:hypothetical protein BU23DRAFT_563971 [Bimuria novae-zelandiae CBS 107.79]|uniref:Phenylacetaldoxime dehydratase n=1 Tax=Bimuria novae-zelandiae CBS 107.79 TaxID=1447943 RepID=A0A6A5VNQ2_9PLEO|nr:hypothetical protein BU23DRAFT_563971 [Bimuria novae-zelandiae CBS 107.79]
MLECTIPQHLRRERSCPVSTPPNWSPPYPAYCARFPKEVDSLVMAVFGAQFASSSLNDGTAISRIKRFMSQGSETVRPSFWEVASVNDKKGALNIAVIAYWPGDESFAGWEEESGFKSWWQSPDRETDGHGWYLEVLHPTLDRFETVFSYNTSPEGAAHLQEHISGEMLEHAYWGSMRDRLAVAQDDDIKAEGTARAAGVSEVPTTSTRIRVAGHKNLCVIRSGQDWSGTVPAERKLYLETMHPVLIEGMNFLRDSGQDIGCYAMNLWDVVDSGTYEANLERTFGLGFFEDLAALEYWSKSHQTHINIFGGFLKYAKKLDNALSLRLFHEVYVLDEGQQFFDCVGSERSIHSYGPLRVDRPASVKHELSALSPTKYVPLRTASTRICTPNFSKPHIIPFPPIMADFAPYQDIPETTRVLSPITSPRASLDRAHNTHSTAGIASPTAQASYQQRDYFSGSPDEDVEEQRSRERVAWNAPLGGPREDVDMFTTSIGLRMDYAACLAYLLLPPAGPVALLVFEHRSDYVRFHAWQSSLLFAFIFVIHIIFSWSSVISWILLAGDLALIGFLTMHAWRDASTLDRYEIPFFGPLATSITDDE